MSSSRNVKKDLNKEKEENIKESEDDFKVQLKATEDNPEDRQWLISHKYLWGQ